MFYLTLVPIQGSVNAKDVNLLCFCIATMTEITFPFGCEDAAKAALEVLKKKVSKKYLAVIYGQEQFDQRSTKELYFVLTHEQLSKTQII